MLELVLVLALQCDGDKCIVVPDPAPPVPHVAVPTEGPQHSVVVRRSRLVMFPVLREAQPARKLVGASLRGAAKLAEIILPPYPNVRENIADRVERRLNRRAKRGNNLAAARLCIRK